MLAQLDKAHSQARQLGTTPATEGSMELQAASDVRQLARRECEHRGLRLRFLTLERNGRWYFRAQAWGADRFVATVQGYLGAQGLVIQRQSIPETATERAERRARRMMHSQGGN